MKLIIIQTANKRFCLVDLNDERTETVALIGKPTFVIGHEHGTDVEVDGYYMQQINQGRIAV